jgi:hypothetical protein
MALLTISGEPGSRWEEVAHGTAQLLRYEFVSPSRFAQWMADEFAEGAIPEPAWRAAAMNILPRMAEKHHLVVALPGAEMLFPPGPLVFRAYVTSPEAQCVGNLMLDLRAEKPEAIRRLRELRAERRKVLGARFGTALHMDAIDLTVNTARMDTMQAAEALAAAAASRLRGQPLLAPSAAEEMQFESRLELARRGIVPAGRARLTHAQFNHPSERVFANLLDFYRIQWEYEPRSFPLQWDKDGNVIEAFTPDFYLPEFDLYVELTTMKQSLVTRKNRKIKLLRAIYPHIQIQVFYQKDFQDLIFKHGLRLAG